VKNRLAKLIIIGLIIRFILIFFAFNNELLDYWGFASFLLDNKLNFSKLLITYKHTGVFFVSIPIYIHCFFLFVFKPFLPGTLSNLLPPVNMESLKLYNEVLKNFINLPNIREILFILKFPYFVFDILSLILLLKIFNKEEEKILSLKFWIFNFGFLFSVYIWGKLESIPIFFILLFFYYFKKEKFVPAYLSLGIAIILRLYPLFLLGILIFSKSDMKKKLSSVLLTISPFLILCLIGELIYPGIIRSSINTALKYQIGGFLKLHFSIFKTPFIYIFPLFYFLLMWHLYFYGKFNYEDILRYSLSIILIFYAFCPFSPQHIAWITPFFVLLFPNYKKLIIPYVVLMLLFIMVSLSGGLSLVKMFSLKLYMKSLHPPEIIRSFLKPLKEVLFGLSRTFFSSTCLFILIYILKDYEKNNRVYKIK